MATKPSIKDIDRGYSEFVKGFADLDGYGVTIGIHAEEGSELAIIAASQEFGTDMIPERSFLRATLDEQDGAYREATADAIRSVLDGKRPAKVALERLGLRVAHDAQGKIRSGIDPALAPATIAAKGSSKPLIDTGRLLRSITYQVRRER
jgi:hypothetical protein